MNTDRQAEAMLTAEQLGLPLNDPTMNRINRAIDLVDAGAVKPVQATKVMPGMRVFNVQSQTDPDTIYTVEIYDQFRSTCTCPDTAAHCKHLIAVRIIERREMEAAWDGFRIDGPSVVHQWLCIFSQP